MKQALSLFALGLMSGLGAFAQEVPLVDTFFGYSFLRVNSDGKIPAFTANGGLFNAGFNLNNHFAIEAEFGGYHNGNIHNVQLDTTSYSYLFGPRFSVGRSRRIDPYVHGLFGVNRTTTSISASSIIIPVNPIVPPAGVTLPTAVNGRYQASQSNFGMAIGGGLDVRMTKRVTLRPIQLDYYLTRFQTKSFEQLINGASSTNKNQNNLRYAAGLMFAWGSH